MNRKTLIGRLGLAATALLIVAATSSAAEARFRGLRLRLGGPIARPPSPSVRPPEPTVTAGSPILLAPILVPRRKLEPQAAQADAGGAADPAPARAPEKAPIRPTVQVAGPWCASNRIVGAGVGFCEVN